VELYKETLLAVAWRTWLSRPPRPSLTVVVKGSFVLAPGELALAGDQPFPEGERWVDDDVERALATPNDLAPFKKRGECFVLGSCHPASPTGRSQIAFQIGSVQKNIAVFGDRTFERGVDRPAEFTSMPLGWERAFGGSGHALNPSGVALPNLEDPQHLIRARGDRPTPACTVPISPSWPERMRRAGTYDKNYLRTRYPGVAEDIDWEYFNEAPADQRIDGYFRGDEEIVLVNLVPGVPSLRARLPGITPRAFLTPARAPDPLAQLWEIPLRLDTIVIDGDALRVRCLWRAVVDVGSEALAEMGSLCVLHDTAKKRSLDECRQVFRAAEAARREEEEALRPAPAKTTLSGIVQGEAPLFKTLMGAELKWAHLDQAMTVAGASPSLMNELAALLEQQGVTLDPSHPLASRLDQLPRDTRPPRSLSDEELRALEARMLDEERQRMRGEGRALRDEVQRALFEGKSCAGWDLRGVDLSRLRLSGGDFRGARFARAILAGTIFGDTDFRDATFEDAELSDAQFEGARFEGASLHFCRVERARFGSAVLDGVSFSECLLRGTRFSRTFARGAELIDSRLEESTFDESVLDGADFTGSYLDGALFARSSLVDAWMIDRVVLRGVRMDRCDVRKLRATGGLDLGGATFAACIADGARFSGAIAKGTDFSFSDLSRAIFSGANLEGAKLMGCRLRGARFDGANLSRAKLVRSDLFEARFEGADLRSADLRGANLFAAELFRANLEGADLELADLSGTRVAR
jgi:uncharacterized protein YjbI with pentapeptide repeats